MAHSLSSKKRIRQNIKQRGLNRARHTALRSKLRRVSDLFVRGTPEEAETAYRAAVKALDSEADRGLIHRNAAARKKSRLAKRLNALKTRAAS